MGQRGWDDGGIPADPPRVETAAELSLGADESLVELRCAVIVARGSDVLLLHRTRAGVEEWVLPGGRPRPGEGMLACARREVAEETGVVVTPDRCAFVADVIAPKGARRCVELVFVAKVAANHSAALEGEEGVEPVWVPVQHVRTLNLRPPVAGFLPGVVLGHAQTAPYLGNLWRPGGPDGETEEDAQEDTARGPDSLLDTSPRRTEDNPGTDT
jgi:8-oxo-dGTP pyrophosphatase MutT (NUDIX family)